MGAARQRIAAQPVRGAAYICQWRAGPVNSASRYSIRCHIDHGTTCTNRQRRRSAKARRSAA